MSEGGDPTDEFKKPDSTVALTPVTTGFPSPTVLGLAFLAVAAAAFLVGIAVASITRTTPSGSKVAEQRVGPSGATIRFAGGELEIPEGALSSPATIVVRRTIVGQRVQVRPPGGAAVVFDSGRLVAYTFEPASLSFSLPATIVFRLSEHASDGEIFARLKNTTLLLGGEFDADRGTVSIEVRDLRFTKGEPAAA